MFSLFLEKYSIMVHAGSTGFIWILTFYSALVDMQIHLGNFIINFMKTKDTIFIYANSAKRTYRNITHYITVILYVVGLSLKFR